MFDWTMTSQRPRAAMPFALKPGWSWKSPVSGMKNAFDGSGSRPCLRSGMTPTRVHRIGDDDAVARDIEVVEEHRPGPERVGLEQFPVPGVEDAPRRSVRRRPTVDPSDRGAGPSPPCPSHPERGLAPSRSRVRPQRQMAPSVQRAGIQPLPPRLDALRPPTVSADRCASAGRTDARRARATAGTTASERPIASATSTASRRTVDAMTVLGSGSRPGSTTLPRPVLHPRNRHEHAHDDTTSGWTRP